VSQDFNACDDRFVHLARHVGRLMQNAVDAFTNPRPPLHRLEVQITRSIGNRTVEDCLHKRITERSSVSWVRIRWTTVFTSSSSP